jgi:hypothetical protein
MSQSYCAVRISEHMAKDINGTLICLAAPICRSGYQRYRASEVDATTDDDTEVDILRPVAEVTSPATIASFEGVDLTLRHPAKFLDPDTHSWSALGHAQNVRIGPKDEDGNVQLVADLFIKDRSLQEAIERGVRDLSCGYRYDLIQLSNGDWAQVNIRGNHIAVVEEGRAGTSKIMDSKDGDMDSAKLDRLCDLLEKLLNQSSEAEDDLPGEATGRAIAEGHGGEALANIGEGVGSAVSGVAGLAAGAMDDELDGDVNPQYTRSAAVNNRGQQPALTDFSPGVIASPNNDRTGAAGNINPVAARDALQSLRKLRPFIEANGDRTAKDAYNRAIKVMRAQIAMADSHHGGKRALATDSRARRQSDAADFESQAAKFHGKAVQLHQPPHTVEDEHRAEDTRQREETFEEAVERVRQEQIARYTPKSRR